ncbi:MAG: hypothetical protein U5N26_11960 [Candidatus Marinimicrobia bacterium]|nr:hypothetical protein [Candidatus Neomarinimicrobiota bacterium]
MLKIYLPAKEVDVNVHPQKTEIKLRNEWQIYHFIRGSISGVLRETLSVINTMDDKPPEAREKVPEYQFSRSGRPGQQEIQPDPGRHPGHPLPNRFPNTTPFPGVSKSSIRI